MRIYGLLTDNDAATNGTNPSLLVNNYRRFSTWHVHAVTGMPGNFIFTIDPMGPEVAAILVGAGAVLFPDFLDRSATLSTSLLNMLPVTWGVLSTDGTYSALKKIHAALGWPMAVPTLY